jgi:hypothetical protein
MRVENLLLFFPAITGYCFTALLHEKYCRVFLWNSIFRITHVEAAIFWIIVLFIPFTIHYILRKRTGYRSFIPALHVFLTLLIIVILPFVYNNVPSISYEWMDLTVPPPLFETWEARMHIANTLWQVLLGIQILFFMYAYTEISSSHFLKRI